MRVGYADTKFALMILIGSSFIMVLLAVWAFQEMPNTEGRLVNFLAICLLAALIYANVGVWLHEQLHCLAFRGAIPKRRTQTSFSRKYILFLDGHYRVVGAIDYRTHVRALLAPFSLSVGLAAVGILGSVILPGWWLPVLLAMAVAAMMDMTHDFHMCLQIRAIGTRGRYWDSGRHMDVVWKEQATRGAELDCRDPLRVA
jgi:hypothetical protein